jgi:hypothetical protein
MGQRLSPPQAIGIALAFVGLMGGLFWWRSQPRGDARAYSEATARLEQSGALDKALEEEKARQALTAEQRRHLDELNRDKAPQAEKDSR